MKKFVLAILSCLIILNMVSCETIKDKEPTNLFNVEDAKSLAGDYMESLSKGDVESANGYSNDKFILEDEAKKLEENKIISYKVDDVTEGSNFAYVKYLVVRSKNNSIQSSLDTIELKVIKDKDEYLVSDVNTKALKEVYENAGSLRVIDEKVGRNDLLLRKKDLPKEVYTKSQDEAILTKATIPDVNFTRINIGFAGVNVAMALEGENSTFISIAQIGSSDGNLNKSDGSDEGYVSTDSALADSLEKKVVKSIVGYDLLDNAKIQKLLFTDDDGDLIVQLVDEKGVSFLRIYKNPTGELLDMNMEEVFPKDKYSANVLKITDEGVYVEAKAISDDSQKEGVYIVDCRNMKITRDKDS